jgi:hypothetical protein
MELYNFFFFFFHSKMRSSLMRWDTAVQKE